MSPVDGPLLIDRLAFDPEAERRELMEGLLRDPASIPPKYFYDELGCAIYGAIGRLPEYYPTRTEAAIFERDKLDMAGALGPVATLVDLGAGNCEKSARQFDAFQVRRYVAIDISAA